jgi:uncharacterized protein
MLSLLSMLGRSERDVSAERVQSVLARVARDSALRDRFERAPDATLAELGLDARERAGMLSAGSKRLLAYHEMVHGRLFKAIRTFIGGAADRLGHDRLRADVDAWIADPGPKTPYFLEIPAEFLGWAQPRWEADSSLAPWVAELAAHQVLIRTIRNDPREIGEPTGKGLDLDAPVACNGTVRVVRYRWAVHRLPKRLGPEQEPAHEPAIVIAYRGPDHQPSFVDIKPRSAHMLEQLLAGASLRAALFGACEAMGETLDDAILSVTAVTLADLFERHVLLGGA